MTDSKKENLNDEREAVKTQFELDMQRLRQELAKRFEEYQKTISFMATDAPIGALCLPKKIEKALLEAGISRLYDLIGRDFAEIEGIDEVGISQLATRFYKFLSMF